MKKAILTGATGFLGRHLAECLSQNGVQVYAVFRNEKRKDVLPAGTICICDDLTDAARLAGKLERNGGVDADVFYHTAWSGVHPELKNDYDYQLKNLQYSMSALDAAYMLGCRRFVNVGATSEYVSRKEGLITGADRPEPDNVYGAMKIAAQYLMNIRAGNRKQAIINTIMTSAYGEYRVDDNVISYTIKTLLRGERPSFGALTQMWDFIYADDAARAFYLIGEKGQEGKTYPIGTGRQSPLREYITQIRDVIDPELPLGIGDKADRYVKVKSSCVDISELQNDTGFAPEYSFSQGIERTIAWMRKEFDLT